MTEAEWLASADPAAMLRFLNGDDGRRLLDLGRKDLVSDRKLLLFGEACCLAIGRTPYEAEHVSATSNPVEWATGWVGHKKDCGNSKIPQAVKAALLREINGNPFRPVYRRDKGYPKSLDAIVLDPDVFTPDVVGMANQAYEWRDFTGLGAMSDALEEAGCTNEDVLGHLRQRYRCKKCGKDVSHLVGEDPPICGGCLWCGSFELEAAPHVRGCWVLDLILGKE